MEKPVTVVTGVIGSDAHVIGNWLLRKTLTKAGMRVVGLGVCVQQHEFVNAAIECAADAILISSIYGMGLLDCGGLRERCVEAGIGDIVIYVGGNVLIGDQTWDNVDAEFRKMGINRVYPPGTSPRACVHDLLIDLGLVPTTEALE